jgi:hypothetical protein
MPLINGDHVINSQFVEIDATSGAGATTLAEFGMSLSSFYPRNSQYTGWRRRTDKRLSGITWGFMFVGETALPLITFGRAVCLILRRS